MNWHIAEPIDLGPQCRQILSLREVGKAPTGTMPIAALLKGDVVGKAHGTDPAAQSVSLLGRRVKAIDMGLAEQNHVVHVVTSTTGRKDHFMPNDRVFQMRVSEEFLQELDNWRRQQAQIPSRTEAARILIEVGMRATKQGDLTHP